MGNAKRTMRREVIIILFLFVILFVVGSLVSYHPADPSLESAGAAGRADNFFGLIGAFLAGLMMFLFGLGSFWLPVLLVLGARKLLDRAPARQWVALCAGGLLLMVSTGAVLEIFQDRYLFLGHSFSAGGILGGQFQSGLVHYTNRTGGSIILLFVWLLCLILATGLRPSKVLAKIRMILGRAYRFVEGRFLLWRGRKKKAQFKAEKQAKRPPKPKKPPKIKKNPKKPVQSPPEQVVFDFAKEEGFVLPPLSLLNDPPERPAGADKKNLEMQARLLEKKLEDFGVHGRVVEVSPGPVITTFEYEPAPGVKINKIKGLSDDLAMALRAVSVRIVGPIPGKAAVGVEIPNTERELVGFKEIVAADDFTKSRSRMTLCLGKDIVGGSTVADLAKMPHLLIAGATGSGKSVALNAMIASLLYKATPDEVKFIMIDPKRIELSNYDGIPHLITPVVTDVKKATNALSWAVREMENRYEAMAAMGARNINGYNQKVAKARKDAKPPAEGEEEKPQLEPFPYLVVIIDELADLMMVASRDVEVFLARLAQMARAAGIHMILATQRPSVDVLTGTIKANFPTRITFQVSSRTDSRTIIDGNGAETLLGMGDMLFMPPGAGKLQRLHGAYISDEELGRVLSFIREQSRPEYNTAVTDEPEKAGGGELSEEDYDAKYDEAVAIVTETRQASISGIQRRLRIGYNRAARIIEVMEREGVVGPSDGVKPREVLVKSYDDD